MIHVNKSKNPPPELEKEGYSGDAVRKQLLQDQHDKCYLCERKLHTNYQVEHLKSRRHSPALENEWTNLFMACEYCNGKKLDDYDDILNPATVHVELVISQKYDAKSEMFCFDPVGEAVDEDARNKTIALLNSLFNGKDPKMPTLKEQRFRQEFRLVYNAFQKQLNDWIAQQDDAEKLKAVELALGIQAEYLGFKYWLVESIPQLKHKLEIVL